MKRIIMLSAIVMMSASSLFISCSSQEEALTLSDRLVQDKDFADASAATLDFVFSAVEHNWLENMVRIQAVIDGRPVSDLSAAELEQINDLLGMDINEYMQRVADFGESVNALYERYPEIAEMSQTERNALFAEVLVSSDIVANHIAELQETARSPFDWIFCYLQDACYSSIDWLVPTVQGLIAYACDFASGIDLPIPFLDAAVDFICITLPGYVEAFLPGICDYIPCEP